MIYMKSKNNFCIILIIILSITLIAPAIFVYGYTFDTILMCDEVDDKTNEPIGVGYIYHTQSGHLYCWLNLTNVEKPLAIEFVWLKPNEEMYRSSIIHTKSGSFPLLIAHDFIMIEGRPPESNPGRWSLEIYIDDVWVTGTEFFLIDYGIIAEEIIRLVYDVENLTKAYDQIRFQYDSLQIEYDELQISYENITTSYNELTYQKNELELLHDDLTSVYDQLTASYNDILDEYDTMVNDYEPLVERLSNARNTMYGAIFGMMMLLAAVAYLIIRSRRQF